MSETLIIIQQGTPVVVTDTATFLGTGTAGDPAACRRLVFPDGVVDGNADPVALAPIVYAVTTTGRCLNPNRTFNLDNVVLPHPTTAAVKTLGSTKVVRFEERDEDVIVTEVWTAGGGASMPTSLFRLFYEYLLNERFIPTGLYITWEPRDRSEKTYLVELLSLSAGGGDGEQRFDLADIRGGDSTTGSIDAVLERVGPAATGLVDVDVSLRMRIVSEA